jgi:Derlin-2/3
MSHHHTLSAVLQLSRCVCEEPGTCTRHFIIRDINRLPLQFSQYWRLLTTFIYFGPLSLDLLFHVFFLQRYSRLLEESSGRSPAGFSWLLLYATSILLCLSPLLSIPFLGSALSSSLVYIWSRRNPETRLSFLGLLVFTAPYLPWVLMAFSLVLHGSVPKDEICGVIVGHGANFISIEFLRFIEAKCVLTSDG